MKELNKRAVALGRRWLLHRDTTAEGNFIALYNPLPAAVSCINYKIHCALMSWPPGL
jgi:hypothetical protein